MLQRTERNRNYLKKKLRCCCCCTFFVCWIYKLCYRCLISSIKLNILFTQKSIHVIDISKRLNRPSKNKQKINRTKRKTRRQRSILTYKTERNSYAFVVVWWCFALLYTFFGAAGKGVVTNNKLFSIKNEWLKKKQNKNIPKSKQRIEL